MELSGFDQQITFLLVADLERSTGFYRDILGLELVLDQGDCRVMRVAADAFVGICERPDRVGTGAVLLTLVTDSVDDWHKALVKSGVPCDQPPRHSETYNVYHAFYRDPDGTLVEIQRFLDPGWSGHISS
jgi:catechol 2,3-dioxygenase-like lactoylglutathione lyase family enzyme